MQGQLTQRILSEHARHILFLLQKTHIFKDLNFHSLHTFIRLHFQLIHSHLLYAFDAQTLNVRMANLVAWRKDANKQKRQANKTLKQQGVKLSRSLSANANLRETRMDECKAEPEAVRFAVIFRSSFSSHSYNPIFLRC